MMAAEARAAEELTKRKTRHTSQSQPLDATRLEIQLDTLRSSLVEDGISMDIHDILKYILHQISASSVKWLR